MNENEFNELIHSQLLEFAGEADLRQENGSTRKTVSWNDILKHKPGKGFRDCSSSDGQVSIHAILCSNGLRTAIWALRVFKGSYIREWMLFKADVAELVLDVFEKEYPEAYELRNAIDAIRMYTAGTIPVEGFIKAQKDAYVCFSRTKDAANDARRTMEKELRSFSIFVDDDLDKKMMPYASALWVAWAASAVYHATDVTETAETVYYDALKANHAVKNLDERVTALLLKYFG